VTTAVCIGAVCPHDDTQESLDSVLAQASSAAVIVQSAVEQLLAGNQDPTELGLYQHGLSEELGPKQ